MLTPNPKDIPTKPGSYQFFSSSGEILYVGKAKNLRNRVMSYFREGPKHNIRINQMLEVANRVEWIVVANETESLLLEYSLIQQHKPRYNVLLKDDKSYPWLAITVNEKWPRAFIFRGKQKRGVKYLGPYVGAYTIRQMLDVLTTIYPMRTCSPSKYADYKRRGRGCLLYDIGKCSAPCINNVTEQEYKEYVDGLLKFLSGDNKDVVSKVKSQMDTASKNMEYERAATLRDRVELLSQIIERQEIYGSIRENFDAIAFVTDNVEICVEIFRIRQGRLLGNRRFVLEPQIGLDTEKVVDEVLLHLYDNQLVDVIPSKIFINQLPDNKNAYEDLLSSQRGEKVSLNLALKGSKKKLVELAQENAKGYLDRRGKTRINDVEHRTNALQDLVNQLELSRVPLRIECFDISHIQGTNTVASMVVLDDGLPKKSDYRHFVIKHGQGNDDFLSMEEAITRRFGAYKKGNASFSTLPDLLLIDGGKGQLSSAMKALDMLGLSNKFDVRSLAKKQEEVFAPLKSESYKIPFGSPSLMLLQVVRDEAHRFAITHHRNKRAASMTQSLLDEIQGLGPARKKQLLRSFGSVKKLKEQSLETLLSLTYLPENVAQALYSVLHEGEVPQEKVD